MQKGRRMHAPKYALGDPQIKKKIREGTLGSGDASLNEEGDLPVGCPHGPTLIASILTSQPQVYIYTLNGPLAQHWACM